MAELYMDQNMPALPELNLLANLSYHVYTSQHHSLITMQIAESLSTFPYRQHLYIVQHYGKQPAESGSDLLEILFSVPNSLNSDILNLLLLRIQFYMQLIDKYN